MPDPKSLAARGLTAVLLPFALIVFLGYAAVGIPISTLPVQVHGAGFGTTMVGAIMGLSAVTTLLTRQLAGALADRRGPKFGVLSGLVITALSGPAMLAAFALPAKAGLAADALGRVCLGLGDSVFTTGLMSWAVARVGPCHAGRAMAWVGIAMYGALALGAPFGAALNAWAGFPGVAVAAGVMPLLAIPVAIFLPGERGVSRRRPAFLGVARAIFAQGFSMVLASAGFGTIAAFLALYYAANGWTGAGLGLTGFGAAYIFMRLLFAGLPDRLGGTNVALGSLAVEAVGLLLIAAAEAPSVALLGAAVTGLGYSLVFPSLGVEAVRRVPAESRGVALGAFLACFDLGLGAAGPVTGMIAGGFGLSASFLAAAFASVLSMALIFGTRPPRQEQS